MRALILLFCLVATSAHANGEDPLAQYLWDKRPLVVFADEPNDPRFTRQMLWIAEDGEELAERDVVVLTDIGGGMTDLRRKLRPRGFMIVLVGKDGQVKLRKPFPWNIRELTRAIDKMPLRQQEMRQ